MSKRILVMFVMLSVLGASNAFATRARLLVMGDGVAGFGGLFGSSTGSLYYDDSYNMFYNPVYVNDYKNWATIEKSSANTSGGSPTAQGGFVTSLMNLNMGVYLNRGDSAVGSWGTGGNYRPIDLTAGMDMGNLKWGFGFTYASFKAGPTDMTNSLLRLRAGVAIMNLEPFVHFNAIGNDNTSAPGTTVKNKLIVLGTKYHWGEWVPYAAWAQMKAEDVKMLNGVVLGVGRNTKVAEGVTLNYAVSFIHTSTDIPGAAVNNNRNIVPIDMSVEADATSWLTARAGLNYHLWDQTMNLSNTVATTGRVGATFHLGKADLDFAVGHSGAASGQAESTAAVGSGFNSDVDSQVFDVNGFFTAAALTYHW
jgi:hypothetical protein